MAITLPSSVSTANVDAATDDPKLARGDILDVMTKFNTLLGQINALGITQVGDGLEIVAAAAGTKDGVSPKLDGTSLARSAAGLKINAGGITLAMLGQNGAATNNIIQWNGSAWVVAAPAASGNQKLKFAKFDTAGSTNWTVPSGVTEVKVTCIGGGGSGGSVQAGFNQSAGGGGGGGTAIKWVTGLTPGNTVNVTVGAAGGASFFGASGSPSCSASGGSAGQSGTGSAGLDNGAGGLGGIGTVGDILISGQPGMVGFGGGAVGGTGGGSTAGGGGISSVITGNSVAGTAGTGYGAGGSGASGFGNANRSGGAGTSGLVIIEWVTT